MSLPLGERLHAFLVGIDAYLPNRLPAGSYPPLTGGVTDVRLVRDYLTQGLRVPEERIRTLTAKRGVEGRPVEPEPEWPTYERLVEGLRTLAREASPGDAVLFYFAGHGGRVPSLFPDLKADGLDECLVPVDIGGSEARYLRDVELAYLVHGMVERGLRVTLVLDCCHSGGAARDISVRGASFVDGIPRPASGVAAPDDLRAAWERLASGRFRDATLGSGWLPEQRDLILLAACRAPEAAFEHAFDGVQQGVFTHWLLDSLRQLGPATTCKRLHDRVVAKVHSHFEVQTPVLEGDGARSVFGDAAGKTAYGVRVLEADLDGRRALLGTGRAHGVGPGSVFAIFPPKAEDLSDVPGRAALAEVTEEIDGTVCWARLTEDPRQPLAAGALATLLAPGDVRLRRGVHILADQHDPVWRQELERCVAAEGFLELQEREEGADFLVAGGPAGLEIQDRAGALLLRLEAATSAETVAARLAHLARFRNIQELDNPDPSSRIAGGLEVDLGRLPGGWSDGRTGLVQAEEISSFDGSAVRDGEWLCLTVRNRSRLRLHFAVLNLQPGWAIQQVAPASRFTDTLLLEAGTAARLPLRAQRSGAGSRGRDILKVFASAKTADFRWLELPRIGEPRSTNKGLATNPLEELFDQLAWTPSNFKALRPRPNLGWAFWDVGQVDFRVEG